MKKKDNKPVKVKGQQDYFNRPFTGGFGTQQQMTGAVGGFGAQRQMLGGMSGISMQQQQQQMLAARHGFGGQYGTRYF